MFLNIALKFGIKLKIYSQQFLLFNNIFTYHEYIYIGYFTQKGISLNEKNEQQYEKWKVEI